MRMYHSVIEVNTFEGNVCLSMCIMALIGLDLNIFLVLRDIKNMLAE